MTLSLKGKTVIVTGAANGVGLAIAKKFTAAKANVMLADIDEDTLNEEVMILKDQGGNTSAFSGDLREKLTLNNLLAATIDTYEEIDILVNASRQMLLSDPLNTEEDAFETLIHQNVIVNLRLSQLVAKKMIAQHPNRENGQTIGTIVNLSSIAATHTLPETFSYSVSSAALNQLTRSLSIALADKGIRVNGVALGSVMRSSLRGMIRDDLDLHDKVIQATPLGRIGEADEVASAVLFLASSEANFITGQILTVDGGRTLIDRMESPAY